MNVADYLAWRLRDEGAGYVFGVPGGASLPYLEALRRSGLEFFLTAEERSAGIMADVYSRLTGKTGICHATFGAGAANLVSGIGCSFLDRSPVIALTNEMPDRWLDRITQMNINHQELFAPVTKATYRLYPENANLILDKAYRICRNEYPGPVHIGFPSDIAGYDIKGTGIKPGAEKKHTGSVKNSEIIKIITGSKSPVIAVGLTAARYNISRELNTLLKKFQAPVFLTPMAKGLLDENHPCYGGVLFHSLSGHLKEIFSHADLIIGLGYDSVEYNYESWIPDVPLIHFDTVASDLPEGNYHIDFIGSPATWFEMMDRFVKESQILKSDILLKVHKKIEDSFNRFSTGFGCVGVLKVLREMLSVNTIVTADVGSHLHIIGQYWKTFGYRNLLMTNGWSSMGFGIPAAITTALVKSSSRIVSITGDGGFLMSAGEIITARRNGLKLTVIVLSDGELNLIKLKQQWSSFQNSGVKLYNDDLFGSDRFFGVKVYRVTSQESLRKALEYADQSNETTIINAIISTEDYNWLIEKQY